MIICVSLAERGLQLSSSDKGPPTTHPASTIDSRVLYRQKYQKINKCVEIEIGHHPAQVQNGKIFKKYKVEATASLTPIEVRGCVEH